MKNKPNEDLNHDKVSGEVVQIPLECIIPNRYQPRKTIEKESLQELIDSISTHGVLQPIVVRPIRSNPIRDGRGAKGATISNGAEKADIYEIMMGERRFRSCQALKKATIPAIITEADDQRMMECALIENTHRKDLNPIERAQAYQQLAQMFHLTQEEVAKRVGANRATITNFIRMLGLPPEIQEDVRRQTITVGHAIAILALPDSTRRQMVWQRVRNEDLSVRNLKVLIDALLHPRGISVTPGARAPQYKEYNSSSDPSLREDEERIQQKLGPKATVHVRYAKQGQLFLFGMINISCHSEDELRRIIKLMG